MNDFPAEDPRETYERFMRAALDEAAAALDHDDVPVGAVVVHNGRIIGRGHNERERLQDPTAHAEILALTAAAQFVKSWRLVECDVYVTLEPCVMCAGAMVHARVRRIIFGAYDPKAGASGSVYDITGDGRLNHQPAVEGGVMENVCSRILQDFFKRQRAMGKK